MLDESADLPDPYKDFSEFYDLYVGDRLDDLPFYLDWARRSRTPVLEIGAGSGRLTVPLAEAGVSVVAVDISSTMLSILRDRLAGLPREVAHRIRVEHADVCGLDLGDRYDVVMVPFYTFNYLITAGAQKAALERIDAHLSSGGRLLVDVFIPWSRIRSCTPEPVLRVDAGDRRTGNHVRGWQSYRIDPGAGMEYRRHTFEITAPDGTATTREFTIQRRYFLPPELEGLFGGAGFAIEEVTTGYDGRPPLQDSEQQTYVLRRN